MKSLLIIFTVLHAFWPAPAGAATEPLPGSDLDGLLAYAREHNPELAAAQHEAFAAVARSKAAGTLADPVLRIEPMDVTNGNPATKFTLMQKLPWYGTRDLRNEVADARREEAAGRVAATWADLATRIKQAYARYYYTKGSEQLTQQTLDLLNGLEQIARTRYANGLGQQQEVIRIQLEQTRLQTELLALRNANHHSHVRLNTLLSRPGNAPLAEPAALRTMPPLAQLDETALLERLEALNPQLRMAEASLRAADRQRELQYADRYPDVTLGVAPTRNNGSFSRWDLMLELNIPLQQSARRDKEREAEAMLTAADHRKRSVLEQKRAALSEALSALETARRTEQLIATRLLPQARLSLDATMAAYETGKSGFAMLIQAQQQLLTIRQQRLRAQTDMQLALADIENLLGESL
ncbi:MAG: TolC family protein [Nitrosomonadales bacterium]|nr:TolC family protein [Nitrosomonadales bacterium]